jgi:ribonuclease HI
MSVNLRAKKVKAINVKKVDTPVVNGLPNSFSYEPEFSLYTEDGFRVTSAGFTVVYTDGSCLANGSVGAKAAVGIYFGPHSPYNCSLPLLDSERKSNNAAEIVASTEALKICRKHNRMNVEIRTDSKFLIGCVLQHLNTWKVNGWIRTNGKPVSNRIELEELNEALRGFEVQWVYVPGHAGEIGNDFADFLARHETFKLMRLNDASYFHK